MTDPNGQQISTPAPQTALLQAAYGAQIAQMLYIAAKLYIADHLKNSHLRTEELASTLGAYDFDQFRKIVDVGGGNGALMVEIMTCYLQPTGIVFDLPRVAESARQTIEPPIRSKQAVNLRHKLTIDR